MNGPGETSDALTIEGGRDTKREGGEGGSLTNFFPGTGHTHTLQPIVSGLIPCELTQPVVPRRPKKKSFTTGSSDNV